MPGGGDKAGPGQDTAWIKARRFLDEIIVRVAIDQRRDVDHDEPLLPIGNVNVGVKGIDRLLLVFRPPDAAGVEREGAREGDAGGVPGANAGALTERRDRRAHDPFRESFLVDVRDVEDFEAAAAVGGVEILAAQDDVLNVVSAMFMRFFQNRAASEMLLKIIRISQLLQMTADGGLRFFRFGPDDGVKSFVTGPDISVAAEEIHRPGAEA